jgi:dimethylhistidine N-methyltransferase
MAQLFGPGADVVEFGAGATRKVRLLLDALDAPARFLALDISGEHLLGAVAELRAEHPRLEVDALVGDFTRLERLPEARGPRLGFFPGGSIGNFEPDHAVEVLQDFRRLLEGGSLLIGVDLLKEPEVLHAAYNDAAGVTAAFNLNLWARANREAGANFDLSAWAHSAFYNPPMRRIEMHLVSRKAQAVSVAGQIFEFKEGDSVHTENSCKYSLADFQALAARGGWHTRAVWTDAKPWFSLHLLTPAPAPKERP